MKMLDAVQEYLQRRKGKAQEICAREVAVLDKHRDLIEELKSIPHLPLDLEFDLERVRAEAKEVSRFVPHRLHANRGLPEEYYKHHEFSFRGQCLIDYVADDEKGMADPPFHLFDEPDATFDDDGRLRFYETPLGRRMPYTISTLRRISPYVNRTRIISTPPGGGIPWHSHHNNVYQNPYMRLCIFNIPLVTQSKVVHGVRDFRDPSAKPIWQHYEEGRIHLFNSWHDHMFWNRGDRDRLVIIPYFNFPDEDLLTFLAKQVDAYRGPRIAP